MGGGDGWGEGKLGVEMETNVLEQQTIKKCGKNFGRKNRENYIYIYTHTYIFI